MNKWKTALLSLAIALVFGFASYYMPDQVGMFWACVISVITFLVSYVFVELTVYLKKLGDTATNSQYTFFKQCGISEYRNDFSQLNFAPCISNASHIRIVLLYSNRFLTNYISVLREFVQREGSILEIVLLSDDKSDHAYQYISEKFGYGQDKLGEKLADFARILSQDLLPYKNAKSTVELYFTDLIPTYSLYMFDDYAYITLYKTAPQRTTIVPSFRIEKAQDSSLFDFIQNDFNEIKERGTLQALGSQAPDAAC